MEEAVKQWSSMFNINELETKEGYEMRTIGYYPGSSWTVVDSEDRLGVNINIKPYK